MDSAHDFAMEMQKKMDANNDAFSFPGFLDSTAWVTRLPQLNVTAENESETGEGGHGPQEFCQETDLLPFIQLDNLKESKSPDKNEQVPLILCQFNSQKFKPSLNKQLSESFILNSVYIHFLVCVCGVYSVLCTESLCMKSCVWIGKI